MDDVVLRFKWINIQVLQCYKLCIFQWDTYTTVEFAFTLEKSIFFKKRFMILFRLPSLLHFCPDNGSLFFVQIARFAPV